RFPVRTVGLAWLIGVVAAGAVYPIAWATGLAGFDPDALTASTGLPALATAAIGLVPGVVPYVLLAIGEQLGWSSFLAVRLSERRSRDVTALTVGSAWAAFHVPMMLFVPGAIDEGVPAALAVAMFLLQCLALAFPMVWLRLRTGSIWPVLVLHAALNATLYFVVEPATVVSESTHLLLGEGGMLTTAGVVAAVLLTLPLWRKAGVTEKRG
ncbi:MAG TPA: CPBP family intramembrane glutamic endopeptidase, partial [Naasia sp.]